MRARLIDLLCGILALGIAMLIPYGIWASMQTTTRVTQERAALAAYRDRLDLDTRTCEWECFDYGGLRTHYYNPAGMDRSVLVCSCNDGSGLAL